MKRKLAVLTSIAICLSSVPMTYAYAAEDEPVTAADSVSVAPNHFVVVGAYNSPATGTYTQLRYTHGDSIDKVAWKNPPMELSYGDVLIADGDITLTKKYEYSNAPNLAMASVYFLNDDASLKKLGNCTELMELRELMVYTQVYDGSGHWSINLVDKNGSYYYGFSTVGSALGVDLVSDVKVGDKVLFAFNDGKIDVPVKVVEKEELPSWIPQSFEEAVAFYNEYGATHIGKDTSDQDIVCLVYPEKDSISYVHTIEADDSSEELYHEKFFDSASATQYQVAVYRNSDAPIEVTFNRDYEPQWTYTFQHNENSELIETDLYAWVPDCITEFDTFEKENGSMVIQDGYVAYCQTSNPSTGYNWTWNQSGDGVLTKALESNCSMKYEDEMIAGASVNTFMLLKPEKDGTVNLNFAYERSWDPNSTIKRIQKTFLISENCTKIEEIFSDDDVIEALPELKEGQARVILTDYETGKLIPEDIISSMEYLMMGTNIGYQVSEKPDDWIVTGPMYSIDTNPYYCDLAKYMNADLFEVQLTSAPEGYYIPEDGTVITKNDNNSLEIQFRLKKSAKGDSNGNGVFSLSDVVLLQKWLMNDPDAQLINWKAADLTEDGLLDVFDLCLMKQELISRK